MADEETNAESTEESSKGGGGLKTMLIVAALMIAEAGALYVVIGAMSGPTAADASQLEGLEGTGEEAPVEIELVQGQYQNLQTGRVWEWRAHIYLRVRQKNVDEVNAILERDSALIKEGVSMIFSRAQDRHLKEPDRSTITRQITSYLNEIVGYDADEFALIDRVLIPELKGFPADN